MRIGRKLAGVPLVAMLSVVTACGNSGDPHSLPSLPTEPMHVATSQDAQRLIAEVFHCEVEQMVPDIGLTGENLADFQYRHAYGMTLLAVTADDYYVWVSADGSRAVEARVVNPQQLILGGRMAGCVH